MGHVGSAGRMMELEHPDALQTQKNKQMLWIQWLMITHFGQNLKVCNALFYRKLVKKWNPVSVTTEYLGTFLQGLESNCCWWCKCDRFLLISTNCKTSKKNKTHYLHFISNCISLEYVHQSSMSCWFDHHGNSFEGVRPPVELGPVDPILVPASIVASPIPHAVQVGMGTHVVPPTPFLVMSTVTCWQIENS